MKQAAKMATPFSYHPGQYIVEDENHPSFSGGVTTIDLGGTETPTRRRRNKYSRVPQRPIGTPRGVTFTPYREQVMLQWEWLSRYDKSILQVALDQNRAADQEPRTIITDTYLDYLLLLTVLGTKNVYGVQVFDGGEEPSTCHIVAKIGDPPRLTKITCYLALIANHCANGCHFCTRTNSIDACCMAYRRGNSIYALCYEKQEEATPIKGVIIVANQ